MGGSNQMIFLITALFVGQGVILGQGSAAVPLLIVGVLLGWAAAPAWTELVLMWPNRVGGISAACAEAFRPYNPVLAALTGTCYWWGWVPTCGLTALLSASAFQHWYFPGLPVEAVAITIVCFFSFVSFGQSTAQCRGKAIRGARPANPHWAQRRRHDLSPRRDRHQCADSQRRRRAVPRQDGWRHMVRFFEPEMDRRLSERYELQRDMRSAIAHGEFALHYQPQAKIDGEVFGFEALVRWFHPTRGLVPPSTFIPLAEQSGMIAEVGEWTLRQACTEAASWPRPLHRSSSVMVIWPASCKSVLADTGLAPGRLELEITEGVLINDQARALATLRRPKLLGVKIAMDDFGTGYASLSGLQSFPFDKLKIDKTFVSGVESNAKSAEIVRAVIGLGRALKIPVIAEGVETAGERSFLMLEGCEELQGYLIGRPAPAATYAMLINGDRANVLMAG